MSIYIAHRRRKTSNAISSSSWVKLCQKLLQADESVASADFVQELCKSGQNDTKLSRFVESFTGCAELSFSCVRTKCQNTTENASISSKRSHFMESGCVASAGWNMLIVAPPLYVLGSLQVTRFIALITDNCYNLTIYRPSYRHSRACLYSL